MLHELRVKSIEKETEECVSVSFDVPKELQGTFEYVSGQYLALESTIHGEKVRRSYSLCSSPLDNEWKVAIKKIPDGRFSTYANEVLKVNDVLHVMPPAGNFRLETSPQHEKHYVAFAAGSGITPILSMIKSVLNQEEKSAFTLFYGNRSFDSIIFREELEALKNVYMDRFTIHHVLSKEKLGSPLFYGRIDGDKCHAFGRYLFDMKKTDAYYLCGPAQMIFSVKEALVDMGIGEEAIHFELFNTDGIQQVQRKEEDDFDPQLHSKVTVILDNDTTAMNLEYGGSSILDAAISNGVDLPFACKGGVCCTCKAKVLEGEAVMDINFGLEPDEVEAGYILTCQAHPRTDSLVVSFDE